MLLCQGPGCREAGCSIYMPQGAVGKATMNPGGGLSFCLERPEVCHLTLQCHPFTLLKG